VNQRTLSRHCGGEWQKKLEQPPLFACLTPTLNPGLHSNGRRNNPNRDFAPSVRWSSDIRPCLAMDPMRSVGHYARCKSCRRVARWIDQPSKPLLFRRAAAGNNPGEAAICPPLEQLTVHALG